MWYKGIHLSSLIKHNSCVTLLIILKFNILNIYLIILNILTVLVLANAFTASSKLISLAFGR